MKEPKRLTYVMQVIRDGSYTEDVYAVVELNRESVTDIMSKVNAFRKVNNSCEDAPKELVYNSSLVRWVDKEDMDDILHSVECAKTGISMYDEVNDYGMAVSSGFAEELPPPVKVSCESLHIRETEVYWKAFLKDRGVDIESKSISAYEIETIANGDSMEFLRHSGEEKPVQSIEDWMWWTVHPSESHYGTYRIAEINKVTNPDLVGSHDSEKTDQKVKSLIEAAPELYMACQSMLEWFDETTEGSFQGIGYWASSSCPHRQMRRACEKVIRQSEE